ncbi:MAG: hypothetical protein KGI58_03900 [Patescibacteria group bacterium]|nr:hypothetical protein [Patescibacteria group bacterium]
MRVNVYAEEMTDRIEIIEKTIDGQKFEACRFYLYLPTSYYRTPSDNVHPCLTNQKPHGELKGPFIHHEGDDDSSAVTFWSRGKLRDILQKAIDLLDEHHRNKNDR